MIGTKLYKGEFTNEEYANEAVWANNNNALIEDKGEYYETVEKEPPLPPTEEEQRQKRAEAYRLEKDPITCQIESLRDEEQTPEIIEEINELLQKRTEVVKDIQERYPYPVGEEDETSN